MTGTNEGTNDVSTTPDGRMNSISDPPFFELPFGSTPVNENPTSTEPPGATGESGVNANSSVRFSGLYSFPFIVHFTSDQCGPPVRANFLSGASFGLESVNRPSVAKELFR